MPFFGVQPVVLDENGNELQVRVGQGRAGQGGQAQCTKGRIGRCNPELIDVRLCPVLAMAMVAWLVVQVKQRC